ncbi:cobalamin biosynthesis protein [Thalassotalea sp. G2M2-11]|uniref:cobalamin biosynthesis protein CobD/CbiB n=1 Tax=Thalassotalea sp. G2M2-11 TaxID=2787627 RepID=UPI0019D1A889|nr:cobalamin biosynthesis protein [Thalassotalea sp. G2M2-11]
MDYLLQLPDSAQHIVVLFVVVVIKLLVSHHSQYTSKHFFYFYCQQLAKKVNKDSHSINHKKVAGAIATLITLLPIVAIVWLFEAFIAVPLLWDGVLLFFAFGPLMLNSVAKKEAEYLSQQNKYQAKQLLAPYVLRETEQMSPLGLTKATIEMLLLRKFQQQLIVGFFFLLLGPLMALSYRMLLEMHYSWNIKRTTYTSFGRFVNQLIAVLLWLPNRIFLFALILTSINRSTMLHWRLVKQHFFRLNNNIVIGYFAYCLGVQLGGVAIYDQEKLRRINFNTQARQPEAKHIIYAIKQLNLLMTLILGVVLSVFIIIAILGPVELPV